MGTEHRQRVVCDLAVSLDGYVAGPGQSREHPLGVGGEQVHRWQFEPPDSESAEVARIVDAGAFVMGRNMFGPVRGPWDEPWDGWWGDDPPYHGPVLVLTHHPREPLVMSGGTTFFFVTDGIEAAVERARGLAGDRDVSVCGGGSTVDQALRADLIDELRLHVVPVLLGAGVRLFDGVRDLDLVPQDARAGRLVVHTGYTRPGLAARP